MQYQGTWKDDWECFVREVADLFGRGLDDAAVTARFAGSRVVWKGKVTGKRLGMSRPGVQMEMPAVNVVLPDGRCSTVDFLFLSVGENQLESWNTPSVGQTVSFSTVIRQSNGLLPGVRWSTLDEKRGVILFLTDDAVLLDGAP